MSSSYKVITFSHSSKDPIIANNCGIANYANRKLTRARHQTHNLNILLIGTPGSGLHTLVNNLFGCNLDARFMDSNASDGAQVAQYSQITHVKTEAGIKLAINITSVNNFTTRSLLSSETYRSSLIDIAHSAHYQLYQKISGTTNNCDIGDDCLSATGKPFDCCLYAVDGVGTMGPQEADFFSLMTHVLTFIPLIMKSDRYTMCELSFAKEKLREYLPFEYQLADSLAFNPQTDSHKQASIDAIKNAWPFAIIGGTRNYSWATVDCQENSDIKALVSLLVKDHYACLDLWARKLWIYGWRCIFLGGQVQHEIFKPLAGENKKIGESNQDSPNTPQSHEQEEGKESKMECDDNEIINSITLSNDDLYMKKSASIGDQMDAIELTQLEIK